MRYGKGEGVEPRGCRDEEAGENRGQREEEGGRG